jgi:hypothetical protein
MYNMMQMTAFMLRIVREAHDRMDTVISMKPHLAEQSSQRIQAQMFFSYTANRFNIELG